MRAFRLLALTFATLVCLAASTAGAQSRTPLLQYGFFAGVSSPVGHFADDVGTGFHLGALVAVRPARTPLGGHLALQWHRFPRETPVGSRDVSDLAVQVYPITANLDLERQMGGGAVHLTAGVGAYHRRARAFVVAPNGSEFTVSTSETFFGLNGGAGATFAVGRRALFVEARLHRVDWPVDSPDGGGSEATVFLPLSIGLRF